MTGERRAPGQPRGGQSAVVRITCGTYSRRWWKVVEGGGRRWKVVEGGGRWWKVAEGGARWGKVGEDGRSSSAAASSAAARSPAAHLSRHAAQGAVVPHEHRSRIEARPDEHLVSELEPNLRELIRDCISLLGIRRQGPRLTAVMRAVTSPQLAVSRPLGHPQLGQAGRARVKDEKELRLRRMFW